jgi:hypothetical protein
MRKTAKPSNFWPDVKIYCKDEIPVKMLVDGVELRGVTGCNVSFDQGVSVETLRITMFAHAEIIRE